ncbi:MAG: hypothetical protein PVF20_03195, partial [Desulfobacterales bacterium]
MTPAMAAMPFRKRGHRPQKALLGRRPRTWGGARIYSHVAIRIGRGCDITRFAAGFPRLPMVLSHRQSSCIPVC